MGELIDSHRILVDNPQELARAEAYRRQQARQEAARLERGRALAGSVVARKDLTARWEALDRKTVTHDMMRSAVVYQGEGPPPVPVPEGTPYGAWYHDSTDDILYRLEH